MLNFYDYVVKFNVIIAFRMNRVAVRKLRWYKSFIIKVTLLSDLMGFAESCCLIN